MLLTTDGHPENLGKFIGSPDLENVCGAVLCYTDEDECPKEMTDAFCAAYQTVSLSRNLQESGGYNTLVIDVYQGMYQAVRHLIGLGHREIGYIGGPEGSNLSREKYRGYEKALEEAGMTPRPEWVYHSGHFDLIGGYAGAREIFMRRETPRAIAAATDALAVGTLKYLLQSKLRVPEDVAVTGFDNIPLSYLYEPALTTVAVPFEEICTAAIRTLLQNPPPRQVIFPTKLIVRSSTDPEAAIELPC